MSIVAQLLVTRTLVQLGISVIITYIRTDLTQYHKRYQYIIGIFTPISSSSGRYIIIIDKYYINFISHVENGPNSTQIMQIKCEQTIRDWIIATADSTSGEMYTLVLSTIKWEIN